MSISTTSEDSTDFEDDMNDTPMEIAPEFSIDTLIQERKMGLYLPAQEPEESEPEDEEIPKLYTIQAFVPRDGSIFNLSEGKNFPFIIMKLLGFPELDKIHCIQPLSRYQYEIFKRCPQFMPPSSTILFGLIQALTIEQQDSTGAILLEYFKSFPKGSLSYSYWLDFFRESVQSSYVTSVYLLSLSKIDMFDKAPFCEVICLHFASMLCPSIRDHPSYGMALDTLRYNLSISQPSYEEIEHISEVCFNSIDDVAIGNVSAVVNLFPYDGCGVHVAFLTFLKILRYLLKCDISNDLSDLPEALKSLKSLCDSRNQDQLIIASATVALTERVFVAALKLNCVSQLVAQQITSALKFSLNAVDVGTMVELREQLHVTRTQLESISSSYFTSDQ